MGYVIDKRRGGPQAEIDNLRAQLAEMSDDREMTMESLQNWTTLALDMKLQRDAARRWARAWKAAAKRRARAALYEQDARP